MDIILSDFVESDYYTKYLLSWFTINESQLWIREDIPLPISAAVFSELYAGNDTPYAFTFNLVEYNRPNVHTESSFVIPHDTTNIMPSNVTTNITPPDVIVNVVPSNVTANHIISNLTNTMNNDTKHSDYISDDISDDISNKIIIENSTIHTPSKQNVLIIQDEPSIIKSEITPNVPVQFVSNNDISELHKSKDFVDEFFSFFSSLLNIK